MKNTFLLIFIPLFFQTASSQTCVPDTSIKSPGYYPETLPPGVAGQNYSGVVQFNIPSDTNVIFGGNQVNANIDSLKVTSLMGLPAGLNYACVPNSCVLPGGETSCGNIYGTIGGSEGGVYPFVIPYRIYARIGGTFPYQQNDTIYKLSMEVNSVGVGKIKYIETARVYPNPSNGNVNIAFPVNATSLDVEIKDVQGRTVNVIIEKDMNIMKLETGVLPAGIYFGSAGNGRDFYYFKFIKN